MRRGPPGAIPHIEIGNNQPNGPDAAESVGAVRVRWVRFAMMWPRTLMGVQEFEGGLGLGRMRIGFRNALLEDLNAAADLLGR
jgi:hypothetical protein